MLILFTLMISTANADIKKGCHLLSSKYIIDDSENLAFSTLCGRDLARLFPEKHHPPADWLRCAANAISSHAIESADAPEASKRIEQSCGYILKHREDYMTNLILSCSDVLSNATEAVQRHDKGALCRKEMLPLQPRGSGDPEDFAIFGAERILKDDVNPYLDLRVLVRPGDYKPNSVEAE